jgi:uncharacterized protein (DUF302 family)
MFKRYLFAGLFLAMMLPTAHAVDGMITMQSAHSVTDTVNRLEKGLSGAGFKIFARVDHGAGAKSVDMPLPPTELLIFGKPAAGTKLMQSQRTVGIELPLKYLVWEDADGKVMVGWNDPAWFTQRHGIDDQAPVVGKMQGALKKFATEASEP